MENWIPSLTSKVMFGYPAVLQVHSRNRKAEIEYNVTQVFLAVFLEDLCIHLLVEGSWQDYQGSARVDQGLGSRVY